MPQHWDLVQLLIWIWWAFFAGLIYYLHREDKREGYPLQYDAGGKTTEGFPPMPAKKTYLHRDGGVH